MRFRLQNDPTSYNINRNKRDIAALDEENDAFVTASSSTTFTNKSISYDQLTGVPMRLQADYNETDDTSFAFIKNKPTTTSSVTQDSADLVTSGGVFSALPATTSSVTENSTALVTSGAVHAALPATTSSVTENSTSLVTSGAVYAALSSTTSSVTESSTALVTSGAVYAALPATTSSVTESSTALVTSGAVFGALSDISTNYESDVATGTTMPSSVGGIPAGTSVDSLNGTSISEILDNLLFPTSSPTRTLASVGLSLSPATTLYEVGSVVTITFSSTANDGAITLNGSVQSSAWTGDLVSAGLSGTLTGTQALSVTGTQSIGSYTLASYTVPLGTHSATLTATWGLGPMPLDSAGGSVASLRCPANYTRTTAKSIEGVHPIQIGTSAGGFTDHGLVSHSANNIYVAQNYDESVPTLRHRFALPSDMLSGRTLRIWNYNASTGQYQNPDNYFWGETTTTVNSVDYTLMTRSGSAVGASQYVFVFT